MHIGLYFGTFNPVHIGHMAIAGYMSEFTDLEQVWFVVTPSSPTKDKKGLLKENHRINILRRVLEENSTKLKASDIEFKLQQPNYTIHTLTHLEEKYPKHIFSLIMGSDNLESLPKWKNYEQILSQHTIYVYPRKGFETSSLLTHKNVILTEAPQIEMSSTFIRQGLKSKKDMRNFLPEPAYEYIREMHFYEK